jgi:hypothetical protein
MTNRIYELARQKMLNPIPTLFVSGATNATPIVITTSLAHGLATSDEVTIRGVAGNTAANGIWTITVLSGTTFSLATSVGNGAYTSGGNVLLTDTLLKKVPWIIRWGVGTSGNLYGDDIKAVFVNVSGAGTLYSVDINQHEFLSDISAAARIATSGNLSSKTVVTGSAGTLVGGVADCDDIAFSAVGPAGTTIEAMVVYKDTGTASTSPLIAYIDSCTGLPFTANGATVTFGVDTGSNRLMKI